MDSCAGKPQTEGAPLSSFPSHSPTLPCPRRTTTSVFQSYACIRIIPRYYVAGMAWAYKQVLGRYRKLKAVGYFVEGSVSWLQNVTSRSSHLVTGMSPLIAERPLSPALVFVLYTQFYK